MLKNLFSVQFSHAVVSDSLWPHGLQNASLPCPSSTPGAYSNSCPSAYSCLFKKTYFRKKRYPLNTAAKNTWVQLLKVRWETTLKQSGLKPQQFILFMTLWVWSWAVFKAGCFFHSIWHWLGSLTHLHSECGWAGWEGPRRLHSHLALSPSPGLSLSMRPLISQQCSPSPLRDSTASQGHSNTSSTFYWAEQVTD